MSGFPRWLRIAVPTAIIVIAIGVIAVVAATGNDDGDSASSPAREHPPTTSAPASTTTSSSVASITEPAPPVAAPPTGDSPASAGSVTARIDLPSHTIAAGSTLSGAVIVENSGPDLQVTTCGDAFVVVLTNDSVQYNNPPRNQCLTTMTIPTGTSRYPITISGSYASCDEIVGSDYPSCLPGGGVPQLPAGEYSSLVLQAPSSPVPISVETVAVTVV